MQERETTREAMKRLEAHNPDLHRQLERARETEREIERRRKEALLDRWSRGYRGLPPARP